MSNMRKINLNNCVILFFVEAKWYNESYVPIMEENTMSAILSSDFMMLIVTSFVRMGNFVTTGIFNWASNIPKIIHASSVSWMMLFHTREHCASAVECYMREHVVSEEACSKLKKQEENAWKYINQELIFSEISKVIPGPVLTRILNLTRITGFFYKNGDGYTHVGKNTKDGIIFTH
ncbi:(+)-delta-cadinene synthase isozyme XC14-like [Gossypium australe]|uniref:(+)-delta-cadinene synthase isozyme XC14-like n=1 Tax=Gossypium australe TaxID=47621 RepID=A0A5B6VUA7_9ROSI|nr:(+)-delta-cadinene synthase isozyme XC14-like [Gossypium australe]